jgi:hypothetical protein
MGRDNQFSKLASYVPLRGAAHNWPTASTDAPAAKPKNSGATRLRKEKTPKDDGDLLAADLVRGRERLDLPIRPRASFAPHPEHSL